MTATTARAEALADLLADQCAVLTTAQALEHLTWDAARWRVRRGWWQRPHRGVLVAHSGPLTTGQRLWVDVLRAGSGAVLAGRTAAALDGLRGYEDPRTHVLVGPGRTPADRAGLVLHRGRLAPEDLHPHRLPPRTRLPRSLVDAARWADDDDQGCALLVAAVQQRLVRATDLARVLERLPKARRRALLLRTVDDIEGGARSLAEIDLVRLCRRHGLPPPEQQVERRDRAGRRRWLDAYWSRWRLHVEVDGSAHRSVQAWWADVRRQNEIWLRGDRLLRFPAHVLRSDPAAVAEAIRDALGTAGLVAPMGAPTPGTATERSLPQTAGL